MELFTQLNGLLPEVFCDYDAFTRRYGAVQCSASSVCVVEAAAVPVAVAVAAAAAEADSAVAALARPAGRLVPIWALESLAALMEPRKQNIRFFTEFFFITISLLCSFPAALGDVLSTYDYLQFNPFEAILPFQKSSHGLLTPILCIQRTATGMAVTVLTSSASFAP